MSKNNIQRNSHKEDYTNSEEKKIKEKKEESTERFFRLVPLRQTVQFPSARFVTLHSLDPSCLLKQTTGYICPDYNRHQTFQKVCQTILSTPDTLTDEIGLCIHPFSFFGLPPYYNKVNQLNIFLMGCHRR